MSEIRTAARELVRNIALISDGAEDAPESEDATEAILGACAVAVDEFMQAILDEAIDQARQAIRDNNADIIRQANAR